MNNSLNGVDWPDSIWNEINTGVLKEVGKVRVGSKVFPTASLEGNPSRIADEIIEFKQMTIKEGETKPFVELYRTFRMTDTQVMREAEERTCQTLAKMAAKELALAGDAYLFQLSDRDPAKRPSSIPILRDATIGKDNWRIDLDFGLLGEAGAPNADDSDPSKVAEFIPVAKTGRGNAEYGENTFRAVTAGITKLVAKAQAPPYALFLPPDKYADTYIPPSSASLVTTAERIIPLVEGGFHPSGVLPTDEGLLVALAGEPTKLFVGREASTEWVRQEESRHIFKVVERVQYVVRDPRSLILLKFS